MFRALFVCLVLAITSGCASFEFALIGDMPYADEAITNAYPKLISDINRRRLAFVVHNGDIKSAASPCTDQLFEERLADFQSFTHPVFYTFGDNEWQDCSANKTNRFDPMERLGKLRQMFAAGDTSLGRRKLKLTRQSTDYPENIRWCYGGILFAGFNIPGEANNFGKPEFAARNAGNCEWLRESFALARKENRRGIMLVIQANPHFDLASTNLLRRGFNEWLTLLEKETVAFGKPVVLVHGDTHYFQIDKPLVSRYSKRRVENFTRVETFGNPDVHWLRARVNPRDPNLFSFQIELVKENFVRHTAPGLRAE